MVGAPVLPLISSQEYLNNSWHPDKEYANGALEDRGMPSYLHSVLQFLVAVWLGRYRAEFRFGVATECRVMLAEQHRCRIPDILLSALPIDLAGSVLRSVPLAVIEIWSPDDRLGHQMIRYREFWQRGVREIIILDPESFQAFRYVDGAIQEAAIEYLELPSGRVPFSSADIFNELREELARQ